MRGAQHRLAVALTLASCAADVKAPAPAPAPSPAARGTAAPDAATPPGEPDSGAPPAASADVPADPSTELARAVDAHLAAANAGDHAAQQAVSRAECWAKECGSFARQAGKKFRAERRESLRRRENHALVVVDILCEGGRKCDLVYLLYELEPSFRWVVVDVTEDGKKADAWVTPPGYVEPRMPPNLPPGAPPPLDAPAPAPAPAPKGNAEISGVVGAQAVPDAARSLAKLRGGFKQCFLAGLREDPSAAGKLVLELDVGPSGEVTKARATKVTGTLPPSVVSCVQLRGAAAQFQAPTGGGAKLRVPITFTPAH